MAPALLRRAAVGARGVTLHAGRHEFPAWPAGWSTSIVDAVGDARAASGHVATTTPRPLSRRWQPTPAQRWRPCLHGVRALSTEAAASYNPAVTFIETTAHTRLPVINLGALVAPAPGSTAEAATAEEQAAAAVNVGRAISDACQEFGFFYVSGHQFDGARQAHALERAAQFFALPSATKRAIGSPPAASAGFTRGYIGMGEESGSDALEVKEAFSYGYEWLIDVHGAPRNGLQGPNEWPSDDALGGPEWRADMNATFSSFIDVSKAVTRGLSLALGHDDDAALMRHCTEGDTISLMRLFHYLPYDAADADDVPEAARVAASAPGTQRIGSSPHTDWGWLTLILQQPDVVGLQLCRPDTNEWVDVPPVPDTLLVNVGDYVSLLSAGEFKSPLHRVVTGDSERTSYVLFAYPDFDANIPMTADAKAQYSLFSDQHQRRDGAASDDGALDLPFGEFIRQKWESVSRDA